ncbi:hypothetical protein [Streptomyces sp. NPDC087300]|uniref:hypothetical protein n=1 Tax=Streptomyces sp. NPDC087300 TaxID=3365780 RepID=UPI00381658C0
MKLVVVPAGLSVPSSTRLLADRLAAAVREHAGTGTEVEFVELRDLAVEIAQSLTTGFPGPALRAVVVPTGVYAASEDWGAQGLAERIGRAGAELAGIVRPARPAREETPGAFGTVVPFEEQLAALRGK